MARGAVDIHVVHHDERRLAPELERDGSQVLGRSGRDLLPGPHRASQSNELGDRVTHERIAECAPSAGQHADDARGSWAWSKIAARASAERGVVELGFTTIALPAINAGATLRATMAEGKFQGVMPTQTP